MSMIKSIITIVCFIVSANRANVLRFEGSGKKVKAHVCAWAAGKLDNHQRGQAADLILHQTAYPVNSMQGVRAPA